MQNKPWLWKARFLDYHAEIDSSLVAEGFYLTYIDVSDEYGSPKAVALWDSFYDSIRKAEHLDKKVALHCHSRGGLIAYNWAKKNADKVACIYADAPVCDFNSWPAGKGISEGSKSDWMGLKKTYGFSSDKKARNYRGNPIFGLDSFVKYKVPIFHSIGLSDQIVPPVENTLLLVENYINLGGMATVYPCVDGIQKLKGHHYKIEMPQKVINFIKQNTLQKKILSSKDYHLTRSGLQNSLLVFSRRKEARVAFLGGSITYNSGWRDSISNYLISRFPNCKFEFVAAGIPSMGSTPAAFRLQRDVLSKGKIDLLFEEAAVNDASNDRTADEQIMAMEGIVRNLRRVNPEIDIVLMHFVDPTKIASYRKGEIPEVIKNHEIVADYYGVSSINLAKEVTDRIDNGEFTWEDDFKNLHPSVFGQGIYAHSMISFLKSNYAASVAEDDKIISYEQPRILNSSSYDNGVLYATSEIQLSKGWDVESYWEPKDGTNTRVNYTQVPMLVGELPGAVLQFPFKGNAVGISVAAGSDAGVIEYRIDKGNWQKQNLFTQWSKHIHLPWYFTLQTGLQRGEHLLEIKLSDKNDVRSSGNVCRIRYFFVNK